MATMITRTGTLAAKTYTITATAVTWLGGSYHGSSTIYNCCYKSGGNDSYISHTSYNDSLQCSNNSRASYNGDYDYRYTGS